MKPVHQTQFYVPPKGEGGDPLKVGNCMAACVASVLELDLDDVPNFAANPPDTYWLSFIEWLMERGWYAVCFEGTFPYPGYYMVSGDSPRGDFKHLVVYCDDELAHDPHPSGDGLRGDPIDQWLLVPLDPGKWERRAPTLTLERTP